MLVHMCAQACAQAEPSKILPSKILPIARHHLASYHCLDSLMLKNPQCNGIQMARQTLFCMVWRDLDIGWAAASEAALSLIEFLGQYICHGCTVVIVVPGAVFHLMMHLCSTSTHLCAAAREVF